MNFELNLLALDCTSPSKVISLSLYIVMMLDDDTYRVVLRGFQFTLGTLVMSKVSNYVVFQKHVDI